jgi:dUTPase
MRARYVPVQDLLEISITVLNSPGTIDRITGRVKVFLVNFGKNNCKSFR